MTEEVPQTVAAPARFWNVRTSLTSGGLAVAGLLVALLRQGGARYVALAVAIYCLHAALVVLSGVTISNGMISFPRSPIRALPFLVLGRIARPIAMIDEITHIGEAFGAQWVIVRFSDEQFPMAFASRDKRLAFFAAVQALKPDVRIYRAY